MLFSENVELSWPICVFVSLSDDIGSLRKYLDWIFPLGLQALLIIRFALQVLLRLITKPLLNLGNDANQAAGEKFCVTIDTSFSNEVGDLARSIDFMRSRLRNTFKNISEEKLRAETTLASISDSIITIGRDGKVEYMNQAALVQNACNAESIVGKRLEQLVNARDIASGELLDSRAVKTMIINGAAYSCDLELLDVAGQLRAIRCRLRPLSIKSGSRAKGAVLVFSDVTGQLNNGDKDPD